MRKSAFLCRFCSCRRHKEARPVPLILQQLLQECIEVFLKSIEQCAVDHYCLFAVDDDEILQRLMVLVNEYETERLHDAHLFNVGAQILNTAAQDRHDVLVEILVGVFDPLFDDAAVELLVIVVVGANLARLVANQKVNVRHDRFCLGGEFCDNLAQCAFYLLDCLFTCFHI